MSFIHLDDFSLERQHKLKNRDFKFLRNSVSSYKILEEDDIKSDSIDFDQEFLNQSIDNEIKEEINIENPITTDMMEDSLPAGNPYDNITEKAKEYKPLELDTTNMFKALELDTTKVETPCKIQQSSSFINIEQKPHDDLSQVNKQMSPEQTSEKTASTKQFFYRRYTNTFNNKSPLKTLNTKSQSGTDLITVKLKVANIKTVQTAKDKQPVTFTQKKRTKIVI